VNSGYFMLGQFRSV